MLNTCRSKTQKAKLHVEQHLRSLKLGESLPSIRTLLAESGVSRAPLERILNVFQKEGFIDRRARQGIFKIANFDKLDEVECLDLVVCANWNRSESSMKDGYVKRDIVGTTNSLMLIECLARQASMNSKGIRLHYYHADDNITSFMSLISRINCKAVIVLFLRNIGLGEILDANGIPWVSMAPVIGPHSHPCIIPSEGTVKLQLEHLWGLGHKKIAFMLSGPNRYFNYGVHRKREEFYSLMADKGHFVLPNWVQECSYNESDVIEAMKKNFADKLAPTAIIAADPQLQGIYSFLLHRGLKVGKDISVIGTDDLPISSVLRPAATTVHNEPTRVVEMAFESLNGLLKGKQVEEVRYAPIELIVRESTGPVAEELILDD